MKILHFITKCEGQQNICKPHLTNPALDLFDGVALSGFVIGGFTLPCWWEEPSGTISTSGISHSKTSKDA